VTPDARNTTISSDLFTKKRGFAQIANGQYGSGVVMNLLYLVPFAWGAVAAFVVAACQVASLSDPSTADQDAEPAPSGTDVETVASG
jgi:hypothetical protein